ncbi:MAG: TolC family protein [Planctomycetota bacterium]|nr:TolC family protein [Planctomycetota bacterium]
MRRNIIFVVSLLLFSVCMPFSAVVSAEEGDAAAVGAGKTKAEFLDPEQGVKLEKAAEAPTAPAKEQAAQKPEAGTKATKAGKAAVAEVDATTFAAPDFIDPDSTDAEPFVSRNEERAGTRAKAKAAKAAAGASKRKLGPVVTTVERPVNVSYEETPTEAIDVAAGETKAGDAPQAPPPPVDEKGAYELVKSNAAVESAPGAMAYLKGKKLLEASFPQVVQRALEKNLSIRYVQKDYDKSPATVTRNKALLDPVFSLSVSGTSTNTYERREFITRRRFIAGELSTEFNENFPQPPQQQQPQTQGDNGTGAITIGNQDNLTVVPDPSSAIDAFAMRGAFDRPSLRVHVMNELLTMGYTQQLPWGSFFSFTLDTEHNKLLFREAVDQDSLPVDSANQITQQNKVMGDASQGQVDRKRDLLVYGAKTAFFEVEHRYHNIPQQAWSSNLALRLSVPVPYCKDWGPNGPVESSVRLARVGQERAYWELKSVINSTLLNVNVAYWKVVGAMRQLEVVTSSRKRFEQVVKQTEEMVTAGRMTKYDVTSAKTSLSASQLREQAAWTQYVQASNALKNILDYEKEAVLLPVGYAGDLAGGVTFKTDDVVPLALQNNPDIQVSRADQKAAWVNTRFAHNQLRPDLKLSTGITWLQNGDVYGYSNINDSWKELLRPDQRDGFVALNFRMPWGNEPAYKRLREAEQRQDQADKTVAAIINTVERNAHDAMVSIASLREQCALALKNQQIAEDVLKQVLELWAVGRLPELEKDKGGPEFTILNKTQDVLEAQLRYISAQIALKQFEAQLLAAQGLLPTRYSDELKISLKPITEPENMTLARGDEPEKKEEPAKAPEKEAGK